MSAFDTAWRSWLRGAVATVGAFTILGSFINLGLFFNLGLFLNLGLFFNHLGLFAQQALAGTAIWNAQQSTPHRSAKIN